MAGVDAMELRAIMARWEHVRAGWLLTNDEETGLLGGADFEGPVGEASSWRAPKMEQRMRLLIDLASSLEDLFIDEHRIRSWLRRPLSSAGGHRPIDLMSVSPDWIRTFRKSAQDFTA
ncbi:MAG TPA: antitoxin Xre/MbcA/ParS toxin-binding domain-containing protein [Allosphingosinicella sp.]|jgi:hypothetical protein